MYTWNKYSKIFVKWGRVYTNSKQLTLETEKQNWKNVHEGAQWERTSIEGLLALVEIPFSRVSHIIFNHAFIDKAIIYFKYHWKF